MKNSLILVMFLFLSTAMFAQSQTGDNFYNKEEALALLSESVTEFNEKGTIEEIPSIGTQIKKARLVKNIGTTSFAAIMGLSEDEIKKIEADELTPTPDLLTQIEDLFEFVFIRG